MPLPYSRETMLERMQASDADYDGLFITGVLSTGIYCLPSCRARKPLPHNVKFFNSPSSARQAGLRACLRCQPDAFYAELPAAEPLLMHVQHLDLRTIRNVQALREALGLTPRQVSELFQREWNTTAAEWLTTRRINQARQALIGGNAEVAQVAFEVGFESLSTFNTQFRRLSFTTPLAFRKRRGEKQFTLSLPHDYPVSEVLADLGRDATGTTCRVDGHTVTAGLRVKGQVLTIQLDFDASDVQITLNEPADPVEIHRVLLRLLGLHRPLDSFRREAVNHAGWTRLLRGREILGLPLTATLFDSVVWAVLGQQVSFKAACTLRKRLYERVGQRLEGGVFAPITAQQVAALSVSELTDTGLTRKRAKSLHAIAEQVAAGELDLKGLGRGSVHTLTRALLNLPGIGPWSAGYVLLRGYGAPDALLPGDSALSAALQRFYHLPHRPAPSEVARLLEPFAPYRSLASFHLWRSLKEPQETP